MSGLRSLRRSKNKSKTPDKQMIEILMKNLSSQKEIKTLPISKVENKRTKYKLYRISSLMSPKRKMPKTNSTPALIAKSSIRDSVSKITWTCI